MSFILDALKKSEAERQRQAGPALLEMRIVRPVRRLPVWAIVVGVLLFGCVLALTWVALRRSSPSVAAGPPAAGAAAASPAAGALPAASGPASPQMAGAPATNGAVASPANADAAAANAPVANAPAASAAPMPPGGTEQPQLAPAADDNPADAAPAEAPSSGLARERADTRGLRNYSELGGTMPELRLDLHVYDSKPAERYAFINMHKVREGEVTPEGVTVKEITPDGVVLEYQGTEFLLGR